MAADQPIKMFSQLKNVKPAGWWEMLKARLFGEIRFSQDQETGAGIIGYSYKGRFYIEAITWGCYAGRPLFRFSFRDPGENPGPGKS